MMGRAALVAWVALWLVGCTPTITCEQTGCPYGQVCSQASGLCERPETDCRKAPSLCRADQLCDDRSGECRSLQVSCVGDALRCPAGQECNTSRGVCQPVTECASDRDCTGRDICDALTRRCAPPPCAAPADCQAGSVCEQGACVAGCLPPESLCPSGQLCRITQGATRGQCLSECGQDTDCPFGRFCDFTRRPPTCEPEPACVADEDCRADEICAQGLCDRAPCTGDADCPQDQRCDALTGACGQCDDDALSPNHSPAAALALESGRFVDLRACPGRPDWFKLTLRTGEEVTARVNAQAAGVELELLDAELRSVTADTRGGAAATLRHVASAAGARYVRVSGASPYELELIRRLVTECRDDRFEENDGPTQASPLRLNPGESVQLSAQLCGEDEDWFALRSVAAESGLGVRLVQSGQPAPTIELWTPDGQRISVEASAERVVRRAGAAGDYLVRVRSPRAQDVAYQLGVNVRAPYVCPSAGQDDSPAQALALEPGQALIQELCPTADGWEQDWIALKAPEAATMLTVKLAPGASAPPLRLALMEQAGDAAPTLIRLGMPETGRTQVLSAQVSPAQTLYLHISAAGAPGRLLDEPTYQLVYQLGEE